LAGAVLLELLLDEMENEANKARRREIVSDHNSKIPPGSNTNPQIELIAKKLIALKTQE
jgi:hypothetical protein